MNYKIIDTFIKLEETRGVIENNGKGIIELAIVSKGDIPKIDNNNILIQPHGKHIYEIQDNQEVYARAVTHRFQSYINVLDIDGEGSGVTNENLMTEEDAQEIINKYI